MRWLVFGLAAAWALGLLVVFLLRVGFPLELEWMEGGMITEASRIQQDLPVYAEPTADFVPYLYPPFYSTVVATLGLVFPMGLALGRVVSILAVLAVGLALWRAVRFEGKPRAHQALAVGLFLASYVFTYRWLDLARADSLFMALAVWGLVLLRECRGDTRKAVAAGLLMGLAFWTKQTSAVLIIASGAAGLLIDWRRTFAYAGVVGLIVVGGLLLGDASSGGWLWHYLFELHQSHAFDTRRLVLESLQLVVEAAPFLVVLVLGLGASLLHRWAREPVRAGEGRLFWAIMAAAGLLVSAVGYSTQWAAVNAFIPATCLGALAIAVLLPVGGAREVVALGLVAAQLVFSAVLEPRIQPLRDHGWSGLLDGYALQDLSITVPSAARRRAASALRAELEGLGGELFAPTRPYWSVLAGGGGHVGYMNLGDVTEVYRQRLQAELAARLRAGRYAAIWLESPPAGWFKHALEGYVETRRLRGDERVLPMTGWMSAAGATAIYPDDQVLLTRRPPPTTP